MKNLLASLNHTTVEDRDREFAEAVSSLQASCDDGSLKGYYACFLWSYGGEVNPIWIVGGYTERSRAEADIAFQRTQRGEASIANAVVVGPRPAVTGKRYQVHGDIPMTEPLEPLFTNTRLNAVKLLEPVFAIRGEDESVAATLVLYEVVKKAGGRDLAPDVDADYEEWSAALARFEAARNLCFRFAYRLTLPQDAVI